MPNGISTLILFYFMDKLTMSSSKYTWPEDRPIGRTKLALLTAFMIGNLAFMTGMLLHASIGQVFNGMLLAGLGEFTYFVYYIEAMIMGAGIVFFVFNIPVVQQFQCQSQKTACFMLFLGLLWNSASWLVHISLHNSIHAPWLPADFIAIDIGFHVPSTIATLVITFFTDRFLMMAIVISEAKFAQGGGKAANENSKVSTVASQNGAVSTTSQSTVSMTASKAPPAAV